MKKELNDLISNFVNNLTELNFLLELPEKYKSQADFLEKELDKFFLPILIKKIQKDIKNPSKDIPKEKLQKNLDILISDYKKNYPENIDKKWKILIKIDQKAFKKFEKQREKRQHCISHQIHIEKAVLFNLISYFENLFSDIIHIILKKHPEILKINEKILTYNELINFSEFDDAKDYLIEQEIEKFLFKPLSEFFDFFENKVFKTTLPNLSKYKNDIIEIKERRNLLIHNWWIINSKYLNIVEKSIQKKFEIEKDKEINLWTKYIEDSIKKVELIGLEILTLVSLKFQEKKEKEEAVWSINEIIYNTFVNSNKNYFLGENLASFILEDCKSYLNDEQKDYFQLNYRYILKEQNKFNLIKDIALKYDISSKNHIIKLCYYTIIDNYTEACKHIIPSMNEDGKFDINFYEEFPILKNLRKQKQAQSIIKKYIKQKKEQKTKKK